MRFLNLFGRVLPVTLVALLGACGDKKPVTPPPVTTPTPEPTPEPTPPPPPAPTTSSGFAYTDPQGTGWRLVKNASSTSTHLVLDLVGPADQKGRGVGFNLRSDGSVKFARFPNGSYVNDLGVFALGNKTGPVSIYGGKAAKDVFISVGGVKEDGKLLTVGVYQKDRRQPAQRLGVPLYQVAIDFDAERTTRLAPGTRIPITFMHARSIPEDIGDNPESKTFDAYTVFDKYRIEDVSIAVGTLVAQ